MLHTAGSRCNTYAVCRCASAVVSRRAGVDMSVPQALLVLVFAVHASHERALPDPQLPRITARNQPPPLSDIHASRPLLGTVFNNVAETGVALTLNVLHNGELKMSQSFNEFTNSSGIKPADLAAVAQKADGLRRDYETRRLRTHIASTSGNLAKKALFLTVNLLFGDAGQGPPTPGQLPLPYQVPPSPGGPPLLTNIAGTTGNTAENGLFLTFNYFAGAGGIVRDKEGEESIQLTVPLRQIVGALPYVSTLFDRIQLPDISHYV